MKKLFVLLASCLLILTGCVSSNTSTDKKEEKVLKMGFVPTKNSEKLVEDIKPLAEKLGEKLGIKVEAFVASNYVGVVEGINSGSVDFGIIPPFATILAKQQSQAEPILVTRNRDRVTGYKSVILTKKDSGINSLADLKGKKVAFVDPTSTSGYIYPGATLVKEGISLENDITSQFSGGHDKSITLLLNGDVDAIGTFETSLSRYKKDFPDAEDKVKVLATSDLIPAITVTASKHMDKDTQAKLKNALLEIQKDEETMKLFGDLFSITGFEEIDQDAYTKVEETAKSMKVDLEKVK
ncbi:MULTISPECIES: phosphate/phosphite/phosphonate ABC transporter substrate-binding protein [unclassified Gemella]|uniref:phosphate/phosphite/phosphonate ABC transporter substrate-binding protein n=1 Tax=unclassified Gemella TaxID=2624949 RepID=UPI001073C7BD|nr:MULTISPECIES: phosphate/phosphite/phosphonate ABC transporter substrate-binding protein [unclassified Gemella]MBF0709696.1 phosphate/phosphite/phosphonate ABC transporter substrate-binding protein [Gemella sp. GL1.1]MBF0746886.1 phosphate/phosphite/phosphonate ABC transporter substrate-binding protein [Gemella sp. 19428wG2_WT2a]NYS27040.1 phosphate/phosphite/phosphonate ABC transporter substrate-binding protein [Gemella sp. GL1]TFU59115.1 phosphate/phosphite/phosphonate ABC transporter subst